MKKVILGALVALLVLGLVIFVAVKLAVGPVPVGNVATSEGYIITKKLAYSELVTGGVDITNNVQGGDLILENIIIETGPYTIASGTNFQIYSFNDLSYGSSSIAFSLPVTQLAASQSFDFGYIKEAATAASSTQKIVVGDGSKLRARCTTLACKSSTAGGLAGTEGYLMITMKFTKVDRQAYIY
jgi:hypothetical protein